jgi:hypothetical protein
VSNDPGQMSPPSERSQRCRAPAGLRCALVLAAAFAATSAEAADAATDSVPVGPAYPTLLSRPSDTPVVGCSFTRPLCVHAPSGTQSTVLRAALADLEKADAALVQALGLPRPLADGSLGGGPGFDLYLVDRLAIFDWQPPSQEPLRLDRWCATGRDGPRPMAWDRSSAFGLIDRRVAAPASGSCVQKNLVARAYASAIRLGIDTAESVASRDAAAAYLAEIVAPCATVSSDLIDDFQAHPDRALTRAGDDGGPAVAMAFHWFLDQKLGAGAPGALPTALLTLGPQRTPPSGWQWLDEPDLFDALRGSLSARTPPTTVGDLLLDFAVARLFIGDRDDGMHLPGSGWAGSFGRVRFEWSIPWTSLPKRLAPLRPVDPTGSTYIWIDLAAAPAGIRLALRAEWEPPVVFRWTVVRIKPDGSEASRLLLTPQERSTSAERNIDNLEGLAAVAIVGTNVGDISLSHPFDPDEAPFEPHGYVVSLAAVAP